MATTKTQELCKKYSYLADIYHKKVFNSERIGMGREDLKQEFEIKIFTTIRTYLKGWRLYRQGKKRRPVPLRYYLQLSMVNKVNDFIRMIDRAKIIPIGGSKEFTFDFGEEKTFDIDFSERTILINDIDILAGLDGKQRQIFFMYMRGYTMPQLKKCFPRVGVERVIRSQISTLREHEGDLRQQKKFVFLQSSNN